MSTISNSGQRPPKTLWDESTVTSNVENSIESKSKAPNLETKGPNLDSTEFSILAVTVRTPSIIHRFGKCLPAIFVPLFFPLRRGFEFNFSTVSRHERGFEFNFSKVSRQGVCS